jgi:outer membrane protein assembly factor BamB
VANGVVYVTSTGGILYAFDANGVLNCSGSPVKCSPLTTFPTQDRGSLYLASSPAVSTGRVYVGSSDGNLYALQLVDTSCCNIK